MNANEDPFDVLFESLRDEIVKRYSATAAGSTTFCGLPASLHEIVKACYAASLTAEEGHPARFQVICSDPQFAHRVDSADGFLAPHQWDHGELKGRLPVTSDEFRKLSAGLDDANSAILVWTFERHPEIWGIVRFPNARGSEFPHQSHAGVFYNALRIWARGPGSLVIDNLSVVLAELVEGKIAYQQSIPILGHMSPMQIRVRELALKGWNLNPRGINPHRFAEDSFTWRHWENVYDHALRSILRSMQQHSRGGTLIISPADNVVQGVSDTRYAFRTMVDGKHPLPGLLFLQFRALNYVEKVDDCFEHRLEKQLREPQLPEWATDHESAVTQSIWGAESRRNDIHSYHADLLRACRMVGRMTATDGAVILSPTLGVLAMGTKLIVLSPVPTPLHITLESIARGATAIPEGLLEYDSPRGSRFNSAVSYASAVPDSMVFLASADGPLSAIFSVDNQVYVAEPLTVALPGGPQW